MSNIATLWPADFPPLEHLSEELCREIFALRQELTRQVKAQEITQDEARRRYDTKRGQLLLVQAELRRGQPWPMLSPTPAQVLEWMARKVREEQRKQAPNTDMPFWHVLRWLVLADVDSRALDPHAFDSPLPASAGQSTS